MKDKDSELKLEEIESTHTLGGSGEGLFTSPGEREVDMVHMLLWCQIHYSQMVTQEQERVLVMSSNIMIRWFVGSLDNDKRKKSD
jgi:hypothetical protein